MNRIIIGKNIKKLRTKAGINQAVIADYLGVDQSLISKIEKGEREISTDNIKKISELFGCKVTSLLSECEEIPEMNIAFRTSTMSAYDLKMIAVINRVMLNLEEMSSLTKERK